jgi:two-component system sensor histidine kinase/response regulator
MKNNTVFSFSRKTLLYIMVVAVIIGNLIDIFYGIKDVKLVYINSINIGLVFFIISLYISNYISSTWSMIILIYISLINVIISHFSISTTLLDYSSHFLRNILLFGLLMPIAAFINGKNLVLIIGLLFFLFMGVTLAISKNEFLIENAAIIIINILGYMAGIYYIIQQLEIKQKELIELNNQLLHYNHDLQTKTDLLAEINTILGEKTQQIEDYAEELKQLVITRDKFYSIISHDLKNPVSHIMGFSELLVRYSNKFDDTKLLNYCKLVEKSSRQTYNLLVNLLEWTHFQTEKVKVKPEWFNINEILLDLLDLHESAVTAKKINISIDESEKINVYADKNMISTVMRNLISNAIKFTYENGFILMNLYKDADWVVFSVKDTGMGINNVDKTKLFKIDNSIQRSGTNAETGTGLGLLLCKDFINIHHGEMSVETIESEGSTFSFSIPIEYKNA